MEKKNSNRGGYACLLLMFPRMGCLFWTEGTKTGGGHCKAALFWQIIKMCERCEYCLLLYVFGATRSIPLESIPYLFRGC